MYIISIYANINHIVMSGNSQLILQLLDCYSIDMSQDFKYFYVSALLHKYKLRVSMTTFLLRVKESFIPLLAIEVKNTWR